MSDKEAREAFEATVRRIGSRPFDLERRGSTYRNDHNAELWEMWKAARRTKPKDTNPPGFFVFL